MISKDLEKTLRSSYDLALNNKHEFVTVEYLLLALLENPASLECLKACATNISKLKESLEKFIQDNNPRVEVLKDTSPTLGFQRVISRAIMHVQSIGNGSKEVSGANVLVAIFGEKESHAVYFLREQGVSRLDVMNYITHGILKGEPEKKAAEPEFEDLTKESSNKTLPTPKSALELFTINLNKLASEGKIDPLIGRTSEVERTIQILCRRRKNNPLLVGEAGVGKTAIAEGLATRIIEGKVPEVLADCVIHSMDIGSLLAGTKYRGDFEMRVKNILKKVQENPKIILFIDEIHNLIGSGSASSGSLDASNLLKPALANGQLKCLGATTYKEFRNIFEKDTALSRRFQKIDISEPTITDTIQILEGLKINFEKHHNVKYSKEALESAVNLSVKYINDRHLPDKAIDVIDEAGASQHILSKSKRKKIIGSTEIENIIAKMVKVPVAKVSNDDKSKLKTLERDLKSVIFGQDLALETLASSVKIARAGLGKIDKPIGSFLFSGPTGVGKTEAARQLAYILGVDLIRFDMSEYSEQFNVTKLIGSSPGFVGYEEGGLLTTEIIKKPYSVLLLDEIEKAHPSIFNVFLQVMDNGNLTDNQGRKADFRNVIIIMTTNAGAESLQKSNMGFTTTAHASDEMADIKRLFKPEFRNRLDTIISFKPLNEKIILQVVDKFLLQLEMQLSEKNIEVSFTNKLRKHLVSKGFDPLMGARPMQKLIQDLIRKSLADELLFGRLVKGGKLKIDWNETKHEINLLIKTKKVSATIL